MPDEIVTITLYHPATNYALSVPTTNEVIYHFLFIHETKVFTK